MEGIPELSVLADQANKAHGQVQNGLRTVIHAAKAAGDSLLAAKDRLPYGEWTQWLENNFRASPETARVYMRIAKHWDSEIAPVLDAGRTLTIEEARQLLRPERDRHNGDRPPLKPTPELLRGYLQGYFKQWVEALPDEAVWVLHEEWPEVFETYAYERMREYLGIEEQER